MLSLEKSGWKFSQNLIIVLIKLKKIWDPEKVLDFYFFFKKSPGGVRASVIFIPPVPISVDTGDKQRLFDFLHFFLLKIGTCCSFICQGTLTRQQ